MTSSSCERAAPARATPAKTRLGRSGLALLLALAGGCRGAAEPAGSPVVARFGDGEVITGAELDRAVLDLPPRIRRPDDGDYVAWYERIARELAFGRILAAEHAASDPEPRSPELEVEARKQAVVAAFIASLPRPPAPTDGEIASFYEARAGEWSRPESRLVRTLFRRVDPGGDDTSAMAEMTALRERALAGESFAELARTHSDSETRHDGGTLGWVAPGRFAAELERILFSLSIGVPSAPIRAQSGIHLFLVERVQPARAFALHDVRATIAHRLMAERLDALLEERVGTALPAGSFVLSGDELVKAIADQDAERVVLAIGDVELTLGALRRAIERLSGQGAQGADAAPGRLLQALAQRERVYLHCREHGLDQGTAIDEHLQRFRERELTVRLVRRDLETALDADPARLEAFYETSRARFSQPLRLHLERLRVPIEGHATASMARLERLRDERGATLAAVATELSGAVDDLGWLTLQDVRRLGGRAASFAGALRTGEVSAPYRTETELVVLRLLERQEPKVRPFVEVRDQVRNTFLAEHAPAEYARRQAEVLTRVGFRVEREELEAMLTRAPD